MKKRVYSLSIKNLLNKTDYNLFVSFTSVASGLIFGVFIYMFCSIEFKSEIYNLFIEFYTVFTNKTKLEIFSGLVLIGLIYFLTMLVLGTSFTGNILSPILTFIKSAGISIVASALYRELGLEGFEYALLIFFPGKYILLISMLIMTKITSEMSREIIHCDKKLFLQIVRMYYIKCTVLFVLFTLSWLVDFICLSIFSDLFNFN